MTPPVMSDQQVEAARGLWQQGYTQAVVMRRYGISQRTAQKLWRRFKDEKAAAEAVAS